MKLNLFEQFDHFTEKPCYNLIGSEANVMSKSVSYINVLDKRNSLLIHLDVKTYDALENS